MVTYKIVPVGKPDDYLPPYLHEVIEAYLKANWDSYQFAPAMNAIRWDYTLEEKVGNITEFALKCYDHEFNIDMRGTNRGSYRYITTVRVHLEGRKVMENKAGNYPIELLYMREKVINIINGNPLALKEDAAIDTMEIVNTSGINEIKRKNVRNHFEIDIPVFCYQFMSRRTLP